MENRTKYKQLKSAVRLGRRVAVYVPGTMGTAAAADNSETVKAAAALLSGLFGGCTITAARGCWMSAAAGLVAEDVQIVYAFTDDDGMERGADAVLDFAVDMKKRLNQEAVSVEIGAELYII